MKALNIAKNPKYDGHQRKIASMVYKLFNKKLLMEQLKIGLYLTKNQQKNYTKQLLENLEKNKQKYTYLL